jgi:hypothetical protein
MPAAVGSVGTAPHAEVGEFGGSRYLAQPSLGISTQKTM